MSLSPLPTLPPSWSWAPLGQMLDGIEAGRSFKCEERPPRDDEVGIVKVSAVTWGEFDAREAKTCTDASRVDPRFFIKQGDFLLSRANTINLVGNAVIVGQAPANLMLSDKILRLRLTGVEPRWVLYALRSPHGRSEIERLATGNQESMRNIGQDRIGQIRLPIAPQADQSRIVAEIEKQFTRLDAGVAALKRLRAHLRRYRAALLKAACEGRLVPTEAALARADGRRYEAARELLERTLLGRQRTRGRAAEALPEVRTLPDGWSWARASDFAEIQGGIQKQPSRAPRGNSFPFLRVANVRRGGLDLQEIHKVELFEGELERLRLQKGDLLIIEGNGSASEIGRMAVWNGSIPDCVHQNHIIRLRPASGVLPSYIAAYWNSPEGRAAIRAKASSTSGLFTLSVSKVGSLPIPIPPSEEQIRIVARIEELLSVADRAEADVQAALQRAGGLRASILRKAFAGTLTRPENELGAAEARRITKMSPTASRNGSAL